MMFTDSTLWLQYQRALDAQQAHHDLTAHRSVASIATLAHQLGLSASEVELLLDLHNPGDTRAVLETLADLLSVVRP